MTRAEKEDLLQELETRYLDDALPDDLAADLLKLSGAALHGVLLLAAKIRRTAQKQLLRRLDLDEDAIDAKS